VGNVSANVYSKFRRTPLHIKKALGIFRELITRRRRRRRRRTGVAFWDPPFGSKNNNLEDRKQQLIPEGFVHPSSSDAFDLLSFTAESHDVADDVVDDLIVTMVTASVAGCFSSVSSHFTA